LGKVLFTKTRTERRYYASYVIIASALMMLIVILQSFKYGIFETTLLLGWDSPSYVWTARYVIAKGPVYMIDAWGFPYFYTLLLAFFGYLAGDMVIVERILPILFGVLLIWANSELVLGITKNIHISGLAAILSPISLNVLRLVSDLHRNLMALSLSMIVLLLIQNFEERKSFTNRRCLSFLLLLFVIAITQFETFFILSLSLVVYGIFAKNLRKLLMFTLVCAIPAAILVSLFPGYFFGYSGTLVYFEIELTANQTLLWLVGSWVLLGFLIVGVFLFYKSGFRNKKLASPIFSWSLVILFLISLIGAKIVRLPTDFIYRSLIILPLPVLLALGAQGCNNLIRHHEPSHTSSFTQKRQLFPVKFRRLLPFVITFFLIGCFGFLTIQYVDITLNPFISRSGYEKILETQRFLANNSLSTPIFIFRGDPPVWYANTYRCYVGAEIGEHFAYYGDIENLLQFIPSEPKIDHDNYLSQLEKYYLTYYYLELIGNMSGYPPPMYVHDSHIKSREVLMSHPIVIITPEFYNQEIPYCIKPFHIGEGIYVIPPYSSIYSSEITCHSEVMDAVVRCI